MKIKKNEIKKVNIIIESFGIRSAYKNGLKEKLVLPSYLINYIEKRLTNKQNKIVSLKQKYVSYYLEEIDGLIYLTRVLGDGREIKVILNEEDLKLIKDIKNIQVEDIKALVKKIDDKEKRFGL
jgi:DNA-binding MarR family transcriptional regulator